jgi:ribose 5-phosphate isomerase B
MGAWAIGRGAAVEVLRAFRDASFEGGRHERRVNKVKAIDDQMRREATATGHGG